MRSKPSAAPLARSVVVACLLLAGSMQASSAQNAIEGDAAAGEAHYELCAACHGLRAEGNRGENAPKLAGQEDWYLRRQLEYFRTGVRGGGPDDVHGPQMAVMSGRLPDHRALDDVVAYIGTLPDVVPDMTLEGDVDRGQALYAVCTACHGVEGEGNPGLSSPRLIRMDDWYVAAQLRAYLDGTRGAHRDDVYGQQMIPVMGVLNDEQAVLDIVAYINSLN